MKSPFAREISELCQETTGLLRLLHGPLFKLESNAGQALVHAVLMDPDKVEGIGQEVVLEEGEHLGCEAGIGLVDQRPILVRLLAIGGWAIGPILLKKHRWPEYYFQSRKVRSCLRDNILKAVSLTRRRLNTRSLFIIYDIISNWKKLPSISMAVLHHYNLQCSSR